MILVGKLDDEEMNDIRLIINGNDDAGQGLIKSTTIYWFCLFNGILEDNGLFD